jgi:hypothetical protein
MDDYVKFIYDKSFGYVVEQKIRDYKKRFPKKEVSDNILDVHALDITEKIFAEAKKHNVELTVIFPPYHKTFLDILYDNNYWTSFWVWKQEVTERATKYSNVMDIWDFANYNDFTLEVIPTKSRDANDMKYFWEPGHFKKALGDEIIEMIYSKKPSDGVRHISLN